MSRFSRTDQLGVQGVLLGHDAEARADLRAVRRRVQAEDATACRRDSGETQPIIRIVEVLPAPLGPRKPNDSPGATSKSMASTAVNSPNRLVRPRAWMSEEGSTGCWGRAPPPTRRVGHGTGMVPRGPSRSRRSAASRRETCYTAVAICARLLVHQPAPGATPMATMPTPVAELLDEPLVAELTVVDGRGRPVTYPLIPLWDGERVYMTSSTLFSRKLEHVAANPKVSVSITDPVAVDGRTDRATHPGRRPGHRRGPARRLGAAAADLGGRRSRRSSCSSRRAWRCPCSSSGRSSRSRRAGSCTGRTGRPRSAPVATVLDGEAA